MNLKEFVFLSKASHPKRYYFFFTLQSQDNFSVFREFNRENII